MPGNNYRPGHATADGGWIYDDGEVLTPEQYNAMRKAAGVSYHEPDGTFVDPKTGTRLSPDEAKKAKDSAEGLGASGASGFTDTADVVRDRPTIAGSNAPGSALNTTLADEDRLRAGTLLASLQQQAAEGGGAWEGTLKDSTDRAGATAMSLGQSLGGQGGYGNQLRNIGNAQGAVEQRAVGQGNILRAQSKIDANNQISGLLDAQGNQDVQQASAESDAKFGPRQLDAAGKAQTAREMAQAQQNTDEIIDRVVSVAGSAAGMSDGGRVPGRSKVFGDDEINDVVPAKLSPGEIVIPRSHADSPEAAADFVRALRSSRGGAQGFAEGGAVPEWSGYDPTRPGFNLFKGNNVAVMNAATAEKRGPQEAPSISNGGLLDPTRFAENRNANIKNQQMLSSRAAGSGPSVAPQLMQNATDDGISAAMRARNGGPAYGDIVHAAAEGVQSGAGSAAQTTAEEQSAGQMGLGKSLAGLRGRDQAMAMAEQQAAWRNTQLNYGIGLEQQALLNNIASANADRTNRYISGTAQGAAGLASALGGEKNKTSDDYARGGPADLHDREDLWSGGEVGAKSGYAQTVKMASGGVVKPEWYSGVIPDDGFVDLGGVSVSADKMSRDDWQRAEAHLRQQDQELIDEAARAKADSAYQETAPLKPGFNPGPPVFAPGPGPASRPVAADNIKSDVISPEALRANLDHGEKMRGEAYASSQLDENTAARLGIRPKAAATPAAPAAPDVPAIQPAQPGQRMATGSGRPGLSNMRGGLDIQSAAAIQAGDAAAEEGRQKAEALGAYEQQLKSMQLDDKIRTDKANARTAEVMAQYKAAQDDMRNINTTVDPGRFWASRDTAGKISGIIGLALGALGTGPDGINRAAAMLDKAVDRDLDAQKAEFAMRIQRGKIGVDAAQSAYAMEHQRFGDEVAASNAAKASLLGLAENNLKKIAAGAQAPQAKAAAMALLGKLQEEKGMAEQKAADAAATRNHANAAAEATRAKPTVAGADKTALTEIENRNKNISNSGTKLLALIDKYGTSETIEPGIEGQMGQLANDMAVDAAKLKDPTSVARPGEVELELKNLFQPGMWQRDASARAKIQAFLDNAASRRATAYEVRGMRAQ